MESGSCCMRRNSARIVVGRQAASWLGVNFWSRTGGPHMWRRYDRAVVREELRVLREHGLTMTRSFFFWPDFMPEPDAIDEDMAARFADFLELDAEQDMSTVPTFIVGHMSGEHWDAGGPGGTCSAMCGWSGGRPGSPPRWCGGSARTPRWRAGWSPTRCRSTAAPTPRTRWCPPGPGSSGTRCARQAAASRSPWGTGPGESRR